MDLIFLSTPTFFHIILPSSLETTTITQENFFFYFQGSIKEIICLAIPAFGRGHRTLGKENPNRRITSF